jgi:beta-lactamase class A
MIRRRTTRSLLLVLTLAVASCGSEDTDDPGDASGEPATSPSTTAAVVPETPVGEAVTFFVDTLNGPDVDEAVYEEHFAPPFRDQVGHADFVAITAQLRAAGQGEWTAEAVEPADAELDAEVDLRSGPTRFLMQIAVGQDPPHRIEGLQLTPRGAEVASIDELKEKVDDLAPESGMLLAEVTDGDCEAHAGLRADERMPVGSAFKLYVLGSLAEEVAAGRLRWDQPVVIRDELDSLPSGVTQDDPAGSSQTVEELALRMISISDNTATDHLVHLVGRRKVEDVQSRMGHDDPAVNVPMLTTKDLFVLKLGLTDDQRATYLASGPEVRRAFLDGELAGRRVAGLDLSAYAEPIAPDTVEWFASQTELCRALLRLDEMSRQPGGEPIRHILGTNPATPADPAFAYVGFKGGSETGVLALAWFIERTDGRRFVLTASALDTEHPIDPAFQDTAVGSVGLVADV